MTQKPNKFVDEVPEGQIDQYVRFPEPEEEDEEEESEEQ